MPKVLIVEDDEVIGQGMARHLAAAGFDPLWVTKGEQGLARLRYERPDVCVHAAPSTTGSTRSRSGLTTTSSSRSR